LYNSDFDYDCDIDLNPHDPKSGNALPNTTVDLYRPLALGQKSLGLETGLCTFQNKFEGGGASKRSVITFSSAVWGVCAPSTAVFAAFWLEITTLMALKMSHFGKHASGPQL